uniref:Uncharacterized protein n=1 Tax=Opuntia streptacantha TaxID=393608 RepID=A0A7C8YXD5_OPUST
MHPSFLMRTPFMSLGSCSKMKVFCKSRQRWMSIIIDWKEEGLHQSWMKSSWVAPLQLLLMPSRKNHQSRTHQRLEIGSSTPLSGMILIIRIIIIRGRGKKQIN